MTSSGCQPRKATPDPAAAQPGLILAAADHHQFLFQTGTRLQSQVEPLVRGEGRHHEIVILAPPPVGTVEVGIDRRIDDVSGAAVAVGDALADGVADGDEVADVVGRAPVPVAQGLEQSANEPGLEAAAEVGLGRCQA